MVEAVHVAKLNVLRLASVQRTSHTPSISFSFPFLSFPSAFVYMTSQLMLALHLRRYASSEWINESYRNH